MTDDITKMDWSALEYISGGIIVYQGAGKSNILFVSSRMLSILECPSEEAFREKYGNNLADATYPEDRANVGNVIKKCFLNQTYTYIRIAFRIYTFTGKIKTIETFITRRDDIYVVAAVDDAHTYVATEDRQLAFRHFIEDGESNGLSYMDPEYKAYAVWNLTKNLPCTVAEGLSYLTSDQLRTYTYDVHCSFLLSLLKNDENRMKAMGYGRENLIKMYKNGVSIAPIELSYQLKGGWINVRTDFYMMEDPNSGDIFLKIQNQNFVSQNIYEKLFENSVKEIYDSVILIDDEADSLLFVNNKKDNNFEKNQYSLNQSFDLVCQRMGVKDVHSKDDLVRLLKERCASREKYRWEYESDGKYYVVAVAPAFYRDNAYSVGIKDITQQVIERAAKEKEDYRNKTIMAALASEYVSVFEVDLPEHHISVLKIYEQSKGLLDIINTGNYENARDAMMKWGVVPEDIPEFKEKTEVDYMRARLQKEDNYSFIYKSQNERYVELKIVRADEVKEGEPKHVIIGYADRDASHREKMAKQEELIHALEQAKSANAAKTNFLSNMSHDIRTPMNAIIGFTDIALKHNDDIETMRDYLKKISLASDQLLSLINDVLDMSKIESGKWELQEEAVSIESSKDNYESIFTSSAGKKGVKFTVETINIQHNTVICDRKCIDRILMNIISNSIKFTEEGGHVSLTIKEEDTHEAGTMLYTFTIKDNGIGMSEEFLKKIFSPFERERTSTASHQQGTGLGMAIVKNLVERINGQIHIESKQGEGTTTTVILPLKIADEELVKENASKQGAEALQSAGSASSGGMTLEGKRILLVDDMDINREIATVILKEQKIDVTQAIDGQQAIDIFRDNPTGFDAILMDVQMPVMDGYDATREIRKLDIPEAKTVPIVAMTANAFAEDRARAIESGMNDHISKPIDVSQLFRILMKYTL